MYEPYGYQWEYAPVTPYAYGVAMPPVHVYPPPRSGGYVWLIVAIVLLLLLGGSFWYQNG